MRSYKFQRKYGYAGVLFLSVKIEITNNKIKIYMSRNLIYMSRNFAMTCYIAYYKSFMAIGMDYSDAGNEVCK